MSSDDQVMSQADIDALLTQVSFTPDASDGNDSPVAPAETPKAQEAPPPPKAAAPPPNKVPEPPKAQKVPPPPKAAAPPPNKVPEPPKAQKVPPPPKAAVPPAPVKTVPAYTKDVSSEVANLQAAVADLVRQVSKMNSAMNKITELDMKITNLGEMVNMSPDAIQALNERIDEIYYYLETVQPGQSDSGIQAQYICSKCHAKQMVALHVKCTYCGNENWMGWWPKSK